MTRHYDIVIVGGGFSGLACAKRAAELGLSVLVVDRKTQPGQAPHTTGIIVQEVLEVLQVPAHLARKVSGVRLYSPGLKFYDLTSPGYYFLTTDTSGYLRHMAYLAEKAGATLQFGYEFQTALQRNANVLLPDLNVSCRYLVGADGARSKVAQTFGLSTNREFLVGVEVEYQGVGDLQPDRLHCFLDSDLAKGYLAWVAPSVDIVQIGLACRPQYKPDIKIFIEKLSGVFDFSRASRVGQRGGLIPVGGKLKHLARDRVLLLGDAAGIVSPLTAGGIYPAICTGQCLAETVFDHLHAQGPAPAEIIHRLYPNSVWKSLLHLALDHAPPNAVLEHLIFSPPFRSLAQTVFFHHRGFFSPAAWREAILNRPALAD